MTIKKLVQQIEKAFAGVTLEDGVGLFESQALDDRLMPEQCAMIRANDEKHDWHKITVLDLYRCTTCLSFFDAKGMRFHLPQIMLYTLGVYQEEDERLDSQGLLKHLDAPDLHWHLTKLDMFDYYYSALNAEQIACVISFLEYIRDNAEVLYGIPHVCTVKEIMRDGGTASTVKSWPHVLTAKEIMCDDLEAIEKALPVWRSRMEQLEKPRKPRGGRRQKPGS